MVERHNRTIKDKLLKILEDKQHEWPRAIDGVLSAHRTARHKSTGFSPFRLLYGRDPVLPIDITHTTDDVETTEREFDEEYVRRVAHAMLDIRKSVSAAATASIQRAQSK